MPGRCLKRRRMKTPVQGAPWLHYGWWDRMWWHSSPPSHNRQIPGRKASLQAPALVLALGEESLKCQCLKLPKGQLWWHRLLASAKARATFVAWSWLSSDLAGVVGCPHPIPPYRKVAVVAQLCGHGHLTFWARRLQSWVPHSCTPISEGWGKSGLLRWFDLTDASQWKQSAKPSWSVF